MFSDILFDILFKQQTINYKKKKNHYRSSTPAQYSLALPITMCFSDKMAYFHITLFIQNVLPCLIQTIVFPPLFTSAHFYFPLDLNF